MGGGLVILGLLVAIVAALIGAVRHDQPGDDVPRAMTVPAAATSAGALTVGNTTAPVTLEVYLDYMCPFCGRFERANSAELERLVADGTVRVELHPLAFLDRASKGTRYSTRTANAVATVADQAPERLLAFSGALFARQPAEGSAGLSDDEIAAVATGAGVPPDVAERFNERTFVTWVAASTDSAFTNDGVTGTPTVKINRRKFEGDLYTAGPLTAAVVAARDRS